MKRAVLIPAHNEERTIGSLLFQIKTKYPKLDIVVVNSNCTDNTAQIANVCGATVINTNKTGYWQALRAGYHHCLEQDYKTIIQMDADGQHPTSAISRLLHASSEHEWVIGSRNNTGSYCSIKTRIGQKYLTYFVGKKHNLYCSDISSGFWCLQKQTCEQLLKYTGETADAAIRAYAHSKGIAIHEIPVAMMNRKTGKSMHDGFSSLVNFTKTFRDLYSQASAGTTADNKSASLSM